MKVLIIGNGSREHALAWKFSRSKRITGLFFIPGNAGTDALGQNLLDIDPEDNAAIVAAAQRLEVDLVFVGPEAPLARGLVDDLEAAGVSSIGPQKKSAQLESSKAFTKDFLERNLIPTATSYTFKDRTLFESYIRTLSGPWVVKKSGLAAGKGVLESDKQEELISFGLDALKDDQVVVEEYLRGFEVSVFTISDGKTWKVLPPTADYKKAGEGNTGPNTGGMGAICPVPWLDKAMFSRIQTELVAPVMSALVKEGLLYKGILYFGLMVTSSGPKILEFNVRFGDPEAQVLIPLIENDFCTLWEAVANQQFEKIELKISPASSLGVVIAAPGYPGNYPKDLSVEIAFENGESNKMLFHASTWLAGSVVRTGGGRCFTAVGIGPELMEARRRAYSILTDVRFEGAWSRPDIGANLYSQKY